MAKTKELKNKIVEHLDGLDPDQLREVLVLLKKLKPIDSQKDRILAYAGIWKNLDSEVTETLTTGLHEKRANNFNRRDLIVK